MDTDETLKKQQSGDLDYHIFIGANEKIVYRTRGVLNNITDGQLILTDNRLFFYFVSNLSRDKIFIATYPYLASVELKEGLLNSTLLIKSMRDSFEIKRIKKDEAREFFQILDKIIKDNQGKKQQS